MKTKNVIVLSGYARSGKTTFARIGKDLGYTTLSTSALLHKFVRMLFESLLHLEINTNDKKGIHAISLVYNNIGNRFLAWSGRDLLILIAEKCLVPVFGRELFAHTVARSINNEAEGNFIYEAFNREECDLFIDYLEKRYINFTVVTIRSDKEEMTVDTRELLTGRYGFVQQDLIIENNDSKERFKQESSDLLKSIFR